MVPASSTPYLLLQVHRWPQWQLVLQHKQTQSPCGRAGCTEGRGSHCGCHQERQDLSGNLRLLTRSYRAGVHSLCRLQPQTQPPECHRLRDFCPSSHMLSSSLSQHVPLQDALTKTIPIWAAVLNRAIAAARFADAPCIAGSTESQAVAAPASKAEDWDSSLHLPPWISENEQRQIESRLPLFQQQLMQVG